MKVLIVGSGGREHTLAWKIRQSKKVSQIFIAPGNAGTVQIGQNIDINAENLKGLLDFALKEKIDLTVVGPEMPLALGIVDLFSKNNLLIFGPSKGVSVCKTKKQALEALKKIMVEKKFGAAGSKLLIEECLTGLEASVIAFTDGQTVLPLLVAQDHKPIFDGDKGPNTGGMGVYAPTPVVDRKMMDQIINQIFHAGTKLVQNKVVTNGN